jgi:hypothetical protein
MLLQKYKPYTHANKKHTAAKHMAKIRSHALASPAAPPVSMPVSSTQQSCSAVTFASRPTGVRPPKMYSFEPGSDKKQRDSVRIHIDVSKSEPVAQGN